MSCVYGNEWVRVSVVRVVVICVNVYWLWRLVLGRCWFVEIVMESGRGE